MWSGSTGMRSMTVSYTHLVGDATDPVDLAGDHISALEEAGGIHSHPHSGGGAGDEDGARRQRHVWKDHILMRET